MLAAQRSCRRKCRNANLISNMHLVVPATVPCSPMTRSPGVMRRFANRNGRRVPQIRREHQNERRDDAEGKKRVQRRQNPAQVSARMDRQPPRNSPGSKAAKSRDRPRIRRNLKARAALGTLEAKRVRSNI